VKNYLNNTIKVELILYMNRIVIIFLVLITTLVYSCNSRPVNDKISLHKNDTGIAVVKFREYEHHFGMVAEGEKVACVFTFDNIGTADCVITSALTTCGCTVPKYDSKPISPGKSGTLEVLFDTSGRNGMQAKTITVKSNASIPVILLKITAEVLDPLN
jgi:hypothetical protein